MNGKWWPIPAGEERSRSPSNRQVPVFPKADTSHVDILIAEHDGPMITTIPTARTRHGNIPHKTSGLGMRFGEYSMYSALVLSECLSNCASCMDLLTLITFGTRLADNSRAMGNRPGQNNE